MSAPDGNDLAELALDLHEGNSLVDTVDRALVYAVKALGCTHAGVILVHEKSSVETVAATDPLVADLDRVQLESGEGPDLEIIADRTSVIVADTRHEERWPRWSQAVADSGIRSMLGTRLYTTSTTLGSLNFYDSEPGRFGPEDADVAHMLARHVAVAMDAARDAEHLWKAIDARNVIGQAQGILMERYGVDADQAFRVLHRYSQDNNLKLHVVAQRLIDTRRLPD